jgi:hypothetical protein
VLGRVDAALLPLPRLYPGRGTRPCGVRPLTSMDARGSLRKDRSRRFSQILQLERDAAHATTESGDAGGDTIGTSARRARSSAASRMCAL